MDDKTTKAIRDWQAAMMKHYYESSPAEKARMDALAAEVFASHPEWQELVKD